MGKKTIIGIVIAVVLLVSGGTLAVSLINKERKSNELSAKIKSEKAKFFALELKLSYELDMAVLASRSIISTYKISWYGLFGGNIDRMISQSADLMEPGFVRLDSCCSSIGYWSSLIKDHPKEYELIYSKTMELYGQVLKYAGYSYIQNQSYWDYMTETDDLLVKISKLQGELGAILEQ